MVFSGLFGLVGLFGRQKAPVLETLRAEFRLQRFEVKPRLMQKQRAQEQWHCIA